ncbi:MAG: chitobiase/beta-hexosaminidase C-terminal domain-containing protein, partial [Vicinamibacterales bacterium]
MAQTTIATRQWTRPARQALLLLVLLASSSRVESSPAQSSDLAVRFSPSAGTFVGSQTVALTVSARADVHYTVDGSLPTAASPLYRTPLTLDKSTRLRAVAVL